jgi:hypothetical protein
MGFNVIQRLEPNTPIVLAVKLGIIDPLGGITIICKRSAPLPIEGNRHTVLFDLNFGDKL